MADLLEISVSDFLVLTQSHTLPWLVLTQQAVVIKRIAEARSAPEPSRMCLDPINWCPILALLLVQSVPDMEAYVLATLKGAASGFKGIEFSELIRIEAASTALCLLKAAGDADDSKKARVSDHASRKSCSLTFGRFELLCNSLLLVLHQLMAIIRGAILLGHSLKCTS
jgi:serine/threonine-protein kinase ATR